MYGCGPVTTPGANLTNGLPHQRTVSMSREFQLKLILKSLIELGYPDVSSFLAQRLLADSVLLQREYETILQNLVTTGDYSEILAVLDGTTKEPESSKELIALLSTFSSEKNNLLTYLTLRFSFIEQVVQYSLGIRPENPIDYIFSILSKRMPDLIGDLLSNLLPPFLRGLSKGGEYSLLLPLILNPPTRDTIKPRVFNPDMLLTSDKLMHEYKPSESNAIAVLRDAFLQSTLECIQNFAADDMKPLSRQISKIPENYLHYLIKNECIEEASKSLYYLPPRTEATNAWPTDDNFGLLHPSRDDLPIHLLHTLNKHTDEVWYTRFSPSGRFLATGSLDGSCLIYDVRDNFNLVAELVATPENDARAFVETSHKPVMDKKKGVIYFSWDPYERYIVTCCLDTVIRVWKVENLTLPRRATRSMFNNENVELVSCFTLGERLRTWPCEFLCYGKHKTPHFIVGSPDKVLKVFAIDGTEILDFYSDADEWLAILGEDQNARGSPNLAGAEDALVASADESSLLTTEANNTSGNGTSQFNRINDFAITPNGRVLVTANNDKQVFFYKIPDLFDPSATTSRFALLSLNGRITSCNISADGKHMLLSIAPEEIQVWDISSLDTFEKPFLKQKFFGQSQSIYIVKSCFGYLTTKSMREELVLSGSDDGHIYIWKAQSGQLITRLKGHEGLCNSVDWNRFYKLDLGPDYGKYWCSVGDDKLVKIWGPKQDQG